MCTFVAQVAGKGSFGAALMSDPEKVRDLCAAMHEGSDRSTPVTVKCRIGTDALHGGDARPSDDAILSGLCRFLETVASGGLVTDFQVHARLAVLGKSYSPAQNRSVPSCATTWCAGRRSGTRSSRCTSTGG